MRPTETAQRANLGAVAVGYALLFGMGIADNARSPAYPKILDHFQLRATEGSLMFAVAAVGSVIVSWSGRYWLHRFGALSSGRFFSAMLALACLGMGAIGFVDVGLCGLVAASLIFGLATTGCSVCANALVSQACNPALRRRFLSGLHAMYGISSLLSPLVVGFGARLGLDWRLSFFVLAAVPLTAAVLAGLPPRPAPRLARAPTVVVAALAGRAAMACVLLALYVVAEIALSTRLPLFAERFWHCDSERAALYLSGFFASLLVGRLLFAFVRLPGTNTSWLLASASASLALYLVGLFVHPAALSACGLSMSLFFPITMAWLQESFGDDAEKMIASAIATIGVALVLMHFGVGVLTDAIGIQRALLVGPLSLAVVIGLLFYLRRVPRDVGCRGSNSRAEG